MELRKAHLIAIACIAAFIAVLIRPEIISALFVFIFMGVVPGTDIMIPWWAMLLGFTIALIFAIRWLFDQPIYRPVTTQQDLSRRASARKRVMRQTGKRRSAHRRMHKQTAKA